MTTSIETTKKWNRVSLTTTLDKTGGVDRAAFNDANAYLHFEFNRILLLSLLTFKMIMHNELNLR